MLMRSLFAAITLLLLSVPLSANTPMLMKVFKTASCGCCGLYVEYLQQHGVVVKVTNVAEMAPIHARFGVPPALQSCHTAIINDYIVEGHVPIGAIKKLLNSGGKVRGIALPGMPANSPGMGSMKHGSLTVYEIPAFGDKPKVFSVE